MPNPFVTTSMVWDADINPEGLAEQWKHTFNLSYGGGQTVSGRLRARMERASRRSSPSPPDAIDVFANFGQFVYDDANPENPLGPRPVVRRQAGPEHRRVDVRLADRRQGLTSPRHLSPARAYAL